MQQAEATELVGQIACPLCGDDRPHHHSDDFVQLERYARPAFEAFMQAQFTSAPSALQFRVNGWGNPRDWAVRGKNLFGVKAGAYWDAQVEAFWQTFAAGWLRHPPCGTFDTFGNFRLNEHEAN